MDAAGNLYGTTSNGGSGNCSGGCGTVFELSRGSSGWTEQTLSDFAGGTKGSFPRDNLILDTKGNLFGTTLYESDYYGNGIVFELTPGGGGWNEKVLHTFYGEYDGNHPVGELTFDAAGNLYGTTEEGGDSNGGTVFQLTPTSSGWTERVIHSFSGGTDGEFLTAGLAVDATGNLYGAAPAGGSGGRGTVFEMSPGSQGDWTLTTLYSFRGKSDGGNTVERLILDAAGNLYGTTSEYGKYGFGVVFEVTP
jgi:uncharacterized repeat protein (TIGR03803 family)